MRPLRLVLPSFRSQLRTNTYYRTKDRQTCFAQDCLRLRPAGPQAASATLSDTSKRKAVPRGSVVRRFKEGE